MLHFRVAIFELGRKNFKSFYSGLDRPSFVRSTFQNFFFCFQKCPAAAIVRQQQLSSGKARLLKQGQSQKHVLKATIGLCAVVAVRHRLFPKFFEGRPPLTFWRPAGLGRCCHFGRDLGLILIDLNAIGRPFRPLRRAGKVQVCGLWRFKMANSTGKEWTTRKNAMLFYEVRILLFVWLMVKAFVFESTVFSGDIWPLSPSKETF